MRAIAMLLVACAAPAAPHPQSRAPIALTYLFERMAL